MNQIIDEAYMNYITELSKTSYLLLKERLDKEGFISVTKQSKKFSEKWGLKIEERELFMEERWKMANLTPNMTEFDYCNKLCDEYNVPTKLITITYNGTKIESYEN